MYEEQYGSSPLDFDHRFIGKMYQGECLEVMRTLPDDSVDMVFCDLPYGTTQNAWDVIIPFDELWEQYNRIVKKGGVVALTAAVPFDKVLGVSNIQNLKTEWIWQKNKATGHLNASHQPLRAHEHILIFCEGKPKSYNPIKTSGHKPMSSVPCLTSRKTEPDIMSRNYGFVEQQPKAGGDTTRHPTTIIPIPVHDNSKKDKFHPTQKPIELCEYFIKTYSNEGDVVLDNTMGSNSTGVAAKNLGRSYIGIEMDEIFFKHAVERFKGETIDRDAIRKELDDRALSLKMKINQ